MKYPVNIGDNEAKVSSYCGLLCRCYFMVYGSITTRRCMSKYQGSY